MWITIQVFLIQLQRLSGLSEALALFVLGPVSSERSVNQKRLDLDLFFIFQN
ncbi:hypothetical protein G3A_01325 [Bacillus sp. 17376]|uniref:Uncharacterized protein n=2 Tax=Mesobacillus boroniphilus TaxID=308892 RepID=W4RQ61_9BACI|nr:hypothetical protein G3A_01325 [Bacillus sp. 17376]GAE46575.1 hypothetical protein JCM21738_3489 [Mesobacillus boroniphilus JCM 21738]